MHRKSVIGCGMKCFKLQGLRWKAGAARYQHAVLYPKTLLSFLWGFGFRVEGFSGSWVIGFGFRCFFRVCGLGKFPLVCNFHKGSTQACCEAFS